MVVGGVGIRSLRAIHGFLLIIKFFRCDEDGNCCCRRSMACSRYESSLEEVFLDGCVGKWDGCCGIWNDDGLEFNRIIAAVDVVLVVDDGMSGLVRMLLLHTVHSSGYEISGVTASLELTET